MFLRGRHPKLMCRKSIIRFYLNHVSSPLNSHQMAPTSRPTTAFILSLISGFLIVVNGVSLGALRRLPEIIARYAPGHMGEMGPFRLEFVESILTTLMLIGIVFGLIILFASVMLYQNPSNKTLWSVIVLVLSILSIVAGGGFLVGTILGIIGGGLGLSWKPK